MARTKQTAPNSTKRHPPISWTRFRLPPNHKWSDWPFLGGPGENASEDQVFDPLKGVPGTCWHSVTLGKMVEDPQEAVIMIQWGYLDDLTNFIESPACEKFLRFLDGENEVAVGDGTGASGEVTAGDETVKSDEVAAPNDENDKLGQVARRRNRFLVLRTWTEVPTADIKGRLALSTYVMAVKDDSYDTLCRTYYKVKGAFGRPHHIGNVGSWFYIPKSWSTLVGEEEGYLSEEWLEKTFGRGSGAQSPRLVESASAETSADAGPQKKCFMCEFDVYSHINENLEWEEKAAPRVKERWEQETGEWVSDGRILHCKRERWDFEEVKSIMASNREKKRKREEDGDAA